MTNEMKNVKMNIGKDGNVSIDCSQETALEMINSLINQGLQHSPDRSVSITKAPAVKRMDHFVKEGDRKRAYAKKSYTTKVPWTDEELQFIVDNLEMQGLWKSPVLKLHTRKAIECMKSRARSKNYVGLGKRTGQRIREMVEAKDKADRKAQHGTDYLSEYTN